MLMKIMIVIFSDVEELDFVGPYEVFSYLSKVGTVSKDVSVFTASEDGAEVVCANGLRVLPHYSFATVPTADWIIIPGGHGRNREMHNPAMLAFVQQAAKQAQIVASVCTGAFILAAAGLLKPGKATTYHLALAELKAFAPELDVTGSRLEKQDNVYMAAGVSAGIDMALELCDLIEPGLGKLVAEKIEYNPAYTALQSVSNVMGQMCSALEQYLHHGPRDMYAVDGNELQQMQQAEKPPLVVDVREAEELLSGMIPGAIHIPLRRLPEEAGSLPADRETPIVTTCRSGNRSAYAAMYLRALGYRNVLNLEYGMTGWLREGLPVVQPSL